MFETKCWCCSEIFEREVEFCDVECPSCKVQVSIYDPSKYEPTKEEDMGRLTDIARSKAPFVKLEMGEDSQPLIYKAWKEVTNSFGQDSFRYTFEVETESGLVTKTFDCPARMFAEAIDKFAFGDKVIITRNQMLDPNGNPIEKKSWYSVRLA